MTAPNHKPLSKENKERFETYKAKHKGWHSLSMVLSNLNVADKHVVFCKEWAAERQDTEGVELANILFTMSKSQRIKLARSTYKTGGV